MLIEIVLPFVVKLSNRVTVHVVVVVAASAAGRVATDDVDVGGGWASPKRAPATPLGHSISPPPSSLSAAAAYGRASQRLRKYNWVSMIE